MTEEERGRRAHRRVKALSTSFGAVVGIVGAAFVIRTLTREWNVVEDAAKRADGLVLLLALGCGLAAMTGIGLAWRRAITLVGGSLPTARALHAYFVGQLGKYIPGGIWPVVGRGEMARRAGVEGPVAYGSTILSLGATYLAAVVLVLGTLPFDVSRAGSATVLWVLALLPIGVAALHPAVIERVLDLVRRVTGRRLVVTVPRWSASVVFVLRHLPSWFLIGTATWLVSEAFDGGGEFANVLLAAVLSWVVGFVIVPVPGGIGVREAVFVATATSLTSGIAATTAVVARVVFVLVDAIGAGVTSARRTRSRVRSG